MTERTYFCTTVFEVEKPWTDGEYGCEYYYPTFEVQAETPGSAKIKALDALKELYPFLGFTDIRVRQVLGGDA